MWLTEITVIYWFRVSRESGQSKTKRRSAKDWEAEANYWRSKVRGYETNLSGSQLGEQSNLLESQSEQLREHNTQMAQHLSRFDKVFFGFYNVHIHVRTKIDWRTHKSI